jgi:UDP-3-O-[3-hydroxymyristoyl] N-acetylglucosamine deacetylase/3-hydroxyacyl-[acyl-carrier-protein] dehydratase
LEKQTTIGGRFTFEGKGLHTGVVVKLTICPAEENYGYKFKRIDIAGEPEIDAIATRVSFTQRGTVLAGDNGETISTIEHLLSALRAMKVDNCLIELNGPEVPILDGSAKPFVDGIRQVGIVEQTAQREYCVIKEKIVYEEPEKGLRIIALPEEYFCAQVNISFDNSRCLGNQYALLESLDDYEEVYDCRTFVFLHEIQVLLQHGLIKGGDLDNAIVFVEQELTDEQRKEISCLMGKEEVTIHPSGVLNVRDLKYNNEAARHKLLDLIGDLALVGKPIKGRIIATKSGHGSNTAFAREIIKKCL